MSNQHKRIVQQTFTKEDVINYLYISPLDEDYISLVTTLRNSVGIIRQVLLPYLSLKEVMVNKILAQSLDLTEMYGL